MDMKITLTALLISTVALSACSNSSNANSDNAAAKKPRATVASIMKAQGSDVEVNAYKDSVARSTQQPQQGSMSLRDRSGNAPLVHYTRSEAKELKRIFPRLPNPDLCMYVFPHLSLEDATIPGYSSCFSMYDKNHYAMPGEMPATLQVNY